MNKTLKRLLAPVLCVAVVAAFALSGCGSSAPSGEAVELNVFAANSLQKALPEVQDLYTKANPNVTFADTQFEASGTLVTKLQEGATCDVLITASKKTMDKLSPTDQQILRMCAVESAKYERELWAKREKESEKKVMDNGTVATKLSETEMAKFVEAVQPVYEKYGKPVNDLVQQIKNVK